MYIIEAKNYFEDLITAAKQYCHDNTPLPFVLGACFIDYFSKMVEGRDKRKWGYIEFVKKYMREIRPEYDTFRYSNGVSDLPIQMYHIFRCGIVHSFSLVQAKTYYKPSYKTSYKYQGRDHSIVLCHRTEAKKRGLQHLQHYTGSQNLDAALFVIEDFLNDLLLVNELIYKKAYQDNKLREKIENWLRISPPINGGY